ncbi:MAG TPA: hypothetical protein VL993_07495 [Stellaceae bacterium]|nr:hypothetical protein [Stellaceae bacterium]
MTNFLGSSGARARQARIITPAAALRIQNSVNGIPRPFGYGQARIAGNLGWYGNFVADFVKSATAGGKGGAGGGGGGKSGASSGTYVYYTGFLLLLCEGPIDSIVQGWESKSAFPIASDSTLAPAFAVFDGDYQQLPWSYLQANYPQAAQNFRGLAYVADSQLFLGTNSELPNFTFDVRFNIADALVETGTVPTSGGTAITAQYFNWDYGVLGHFTVPYSSSYQVVPSLNPTVMSGLAEAIDNSTLGDDWFLSDSSGAIWDQGATNGSPGQPLTRVASSLTPSTGQYSVTADDTPVFTFAAADAGQPVVVVAAALSPGVCYAETVTGTLSAGSTMVSNVLPSAAGLAPSQRVLSGAGIVPGTFVTSVQSGTATGTLSAGSPIVANVAGNFSTSPGSPVTDAAGAIAPGTTVSALVQASVTVGTSAALTASEVTFNSAFTTKAILDGTAQLSSVAAFGGIAVGAEAYCESYWSGGIEVVAVNAGAGTVQLATNPAVLSGTAVPVTFVTQFTGAVTSGSAVISAPSQLATLTTACLLTDSIGAFPSGTAVTAITLGSITLSANATANAANDALTFAASFTLS